jgi:hypothetical protein
MFMNPAGFIDGSIVRDHLASTIVTPFGQAKGDPASGGDPQRGSAEGDAAAAGCCWIFLATTDCSTRELTGLAQLSRGAAAGTCCWILVATTGCSADAEAAGPPSKSGGAVPCCWLLIGTTACSDDRDSLTRLSGRGKGDAAFRSSPPAPDCCWIIVATTSCTT